MNEDISLGKYQTYFRSRLQHYNEKKYWSRRAKVVEPTNHVSKLLKAYYLYYIKRCDAFNNATTGAHIGYGAEFAGIPQLPHGLYGIVVSHNSVIGKNCRIYHQVTIGESREGAPAIGDDVVIGAGAKIIGNIHIGNGAKIGANCTVMCDIPENAVVLAQEPKIIIKSRDNTNE